MLRQLAVGNPGYAGFQEQLQYPIRVADVGR
jgi:hypothetical protein